MKIQEMLERGYVVKHYISEASKSSKAKKPQEMAKQDNTNQGEDHQTAGKQDTRTQAGVKVKGAGE